MWSHQDLRLLNSGCLHLIKPLPVPLSELWGSPWSQTAFSPVRGRRQLCSNSSHETPPPEMMLSCYSVCHCGHNPWDHYFHTAAQLKLKCRALKLVISSHLGFMSRNFWRMLETAWWDACWLLVDLIWADEQNTSHAFFIIWQEGDRPLNVAQPSQFHKLAYKTLARIMLPGNSNSSSKYTWMLTITLWEQNYPP